MAGWLHFWTRNSQILVLTDAHAELTAIQNIALDYLATNPPAGASVRANKIIAAAQQDGKTILEAIKLLTNGSSPLWYRSGVIRQINSVVIAYMAIQIMITEGEREEAMIQQEVDRIQDIMSALDI